QQRIVAAVRVGVCGGPGAEVKDDRTQLFNRLDGRVWADARVLIMSCGDGVEQFLLLGEDDLWLVAEVAKERGAADRGALGDGADRHAVRAVRREQLSGSADDACACAAALAPDKGKGRSHGVVVAIYRSPFHSVHRVVWY